jgi:membrane peptidoglycan carboxypeptidase
VPGNARPLRRRNEILALMARNGYIPENLAKRLQAELVLVATVTTNPVKTQAPAAIDTVFDELRQHGAGRFGVEDLFRGKITVHATVDQRMQTALGASEVRLLELAGAYRAMASKGSWRRRARCSDSRGGDRVRPRPCDRGC